jgi:uncharacterized protein (TIGR00369 family)
MGRTVYDLAGDAVDGELLELAPADRPVVPDDSMLATLGMTLTHVARGRARVAMTVAPVHLNQRGAVQAGAFVALADAAAGWATYASVEHGGFTTLELRTSLLRGAKVGDELVADARAVHLGRRTAVFEVDVNAVRRLVARFGCTQLVLPPEGRS